VNRNIITLEDATQLANLAQPQRDAVLLQIGPSMPGSTDTAPPAGGAPKPDNYFDRLLKYVPAEVVSAYVVLAAPIPDTFAGEAVHRAYLALLLVGAVVTPLFARSVLHVTRMKQLAVTTLGFVIFVASSGEAFSGYGWWKGFYALAAAVLFLLLVAMVNLGPLPEN
jgi:hypothetical protein